jgi:NitT/TauT family transport system ATP-binding protein
MITHDVEEAIFLSQRIYVLSTRPGTVRKELSIDLPGERSYQIKRNPKFQDYKDEVMGLLRLPEEEAVLVGATHS